jgi:hypothetical protein
VERIEYTTVDKSTWGEGPWQHEPDKVQWADPATGLPCLIVRNFIGALCGYVGIAAGHPYFGKPYGAIAVEVHGGLTYSDHCQPDGEESERICHIPGPAESDDVWWLGFDCGHAWDLAPGFVARFYEEGLGRSLCNAGEKYRDIGYVEAEVTRLAAQLV